MVQLTALVPTPTDKTDGVMLPVSVLVPGAVRESCRHVGRSPAQAIVYRKRTQACWAITDDLDRPEASMQTSSVDMGSSGPDQTNANPAGQS